MITQAPLRASTTWSPVWPISLVSLVSGLAHHARAIRRDGRVSLLLTEAARKGDPLTHARLSLAALAHPLPRNDPTHDRLRTLWLARHPKAQMWIDFEDFFFVRFETCVRESTVVGILGFVSLGHWIVKARDEGHYDEFVLLVGLFWVILAARIGYPKRIDDRWVHIAGAGKAFRQNFPEGYPPH